MPDEPRTATSRRSVLAAALGAAAAWAASAVGRPSTVRAGVDGDVVLGAANTASGVTTIDNAGSDALVGRSHSTTHSGLWGDNPAGGYGVAGSADGKAAGVWGSNTVGMGVKGSADTGIGVFGTSKGNAIVGQTTTDAYSGVWGFSNAGGIGVFGSTDSPTNGGVYAVNDGIGPAVLAKTKGGTGVAGTSDSGIGVDASSSNGVALSVTGKVRFSRSGKASITAGHKSVKVTLAGVSSSTLVFANLATLVSGRYVAAVVAKPGSFTIYLNANVTAKVSLVWFVLEP